ncbi:MAG: pyridoxamine 5'-phosphate oxidase family protein [Candidatus Dormibacteraeota bacterium]|uniref:Pyridoxamine 5'-phosphate oxidase family protein n=1 Tax=Candidatus Dormiibacter inghamiae TaxID=3127013 RepID=A0A934KFD5_9BACT|nr:pyridoxamine 5'-phosphate oxidase family protein [Candidatus Dormibacteraeota bacterium]MBJ7604994.1 pyridoxamine 5'-phosphate oxidase family protein [Candidatus Dormibacteraeota bacterium]
MAAAVHLDAQAHELLTGAQLGMLAVSGQQLPLVNPTAFHFAGQRILTTTSRHAVKLRLARRQARAAFLVSSGQRALSFEGRLEIFDPLDLRSQLRAAREGPSFALGLAGYALKQAAYAGGYLLDLPAVPGQWWPQNRILLRFTPERARESGLDASAEDALPARLKHLPPGFASPLAGEGEAALAWWGTGGLVLTPALWAAAPDGAFLWANGPAGRGPFAAAVAIEHRHRFRASRQLGVCLRGHLAPDDEAAERVAARYPVHELGQGRGYRLDLVKVSWWRGFGVGTLPVLSAVRETR